MGPTPKPNPNQFQIRGLVLVEELLSRLSLESNTLCKKPRSDLDHVHPSQHFVITRPALVKAIKYILYCRLLRHLNLSFHGLKLYRHQSLVPIMLGYVKLYKLCFSIYIYFRLNSLVHCTSLNHQSIVSTEHAHHCSASLKAKNVLA